MPGNIKTMDGNTATARIPYAFTDMVAICPITPSTPMAEGVDERAAKGKKNLFGQPMRLMEMQSEAGVAGAVHGALQAGASATTYTTSQGLLLMILDLYKVAGELLPGVFHVSARALTTNSLNIFGDRQGVMVVRQAGCAMLVGNNVQQVMDLSAAAHLTVIAGRIPSINFFDGLHTPYEIQRIEVLTYEQLATLPDRPALERFRRQALHPDHPVIRGTAQSPDIYFQEREAGNRFYLTLPDLVGSYMAKITVLAGRGYHLLNYHGVPDVERVIIAAGSVCDTVQEVMETLNAAGEKVGLPNVHLHRPFSPAHFFAQLPASVQRIAVLDRTKGPGAQAGPLCLDVKNAFYQRDGAPLIVGGRYALGGKDVLPNDTAAVSDNLRQSLSKDGFTLGTVDDVAFTLLPTRQKPLVISHAGITVCKFQGTGSGGTVGVNKSAIEIIGDNAPLYAQVCFSYDSKKSGGIAASYLRFGDRPITSPYLIHRADFTACFQQFYVDRYDLLEGLEPGDTPLLNCSRSEAELEQYLSVSARRYLAQEKIDFYTLNAVDTVHEPDLGECFNMLMRVTSFKLMAIVDPQTATDYLKQAVERSYGSKGAGVTETSQWTIKLGMMALHRAAVPAHWATFEASASQASALIPDFIRDILQPMNRQCGDLLPVSAFAGMEDGTFPSGVAAWEKRGIVLEVSVWQPDGCTQCSQCAFVCSHAAVRPALLSAEEQGTAPAGLLSKPAQGAEDYHYHLAISPLDCSGCGNCVENCPSRGKTLQMVSLDSQRAVVPVWDHVLGLAPEDNSFHKTTVKGSQLETPLLEFSGVYAGCGETFCTRLIIQLFSDRMLIANATGCFSIWGANAPSVPYTINHRGHGPAWANSPSEDNAEFGLGMTLGGQVIRQQIAEELTAALVLSVSDALYVAMWQWLTQQDEGEETCERADRFSALLTAEKEDVPSLEQLWQNRDYFVRRSQRVFNGDGWIYDIGFGGLDHVLASGEDVNVLVSDTEVYFNTGDQSSKSVPVTTIVKSAAQGKRTRKKDLGTMAMSYGSVYVAQIATSADKDQTLRAIAKAEVWPGPSLVIACATCINHGLKVGMRCSQRETERAVEAGYWHSRHYHPQREVEGKTLFILDPEESEESSHDFLFGEAHYVALHKTTPDLVDALFRQTEDDAWARFGQYQWLAGEEQAVDQ